MKAGGLRTTPRLRRQRRAVTTTGATGIRCLGRSRCLGPPRMEATGSLHCLRERGAAALGQGPLPTAFETFGSPWEVARSAWI